jgi:hypothetical protein
MGSFGKEHKTNPSRDDIACGRSGGTSDCTFADEVLPNLLMESGDMLRRLELVRRLDVDFVKPLAGAGFQPASDRIVCIVGTRLMRPRNLALFVCDHDDFADGLHGVLL